MKPEKIIIIGGGPAGMMTAIQLQRYGLTPRLFEDRRPGGLLWNANLVENYPGFPQGIPGPVLIDRFRDHFASLGLTFTPEKVLQLDFENDLFQVSTANTTYHARVVVVASGTRPITFPHGFIPPAAENRVFYEVAPLLDIKEQSVAIIGAGDAAFDYAINLSRHNHALILNRGEDIKALPLLVARARRSPAIEYHDRTMVVSVAEASGRLLLETSCEGKADTILVDFLIGAIGREENRPPVGAGLESAESHLVETGRLYYIGDVRNGIYRQTAIAVGDGLKAAMQIQSLFSEK